MKIKSVVLAISVLLSANALADNYIEEYDYAMDGCLTAPVSEDIHEKGYRILTPKYSFSEIQYYVSDDMGYEWVEYAEAAAEEINDIKSNLHVTIVKEPTNKSSTISYDDDLDYCVAAGALPPNRGLGKKIVINPRVDSYYNKKQKVGILIHEMLHTVGFKYAGTDDGSFIKRTDHIGLWKDAKFKPIMRPDTGNFEVTLLDKFSIRRVFPKK